MHLIERLNEFAVGWLASRDPAQREVIIASLFLVTLLVVGTVGYSLLEGWSLMDSLYMTFITLTTIGFSEVHPLSSGARVFTIFIAIVGIGSVAFIATRTAQLLLTSQRLRERHMFKRITRMTDHFVVCGYGRIGRRICEDLTISRRPFVVIDRDEEEIEELRDRNFLFVEGDAEEEETLLSAGLDKARGLILALPEDSANVFVTLMARELNADIFILARTNYHKNRRKLLHAGANKVVSPDEIGADRMAQVILRPNVDRFMEQVLRAGALGLLMDEVEVKPGAPLAGKSLAESNFRQQFDAIVIAVIDGATGDMRFNPSAHDEISTTDILIVLGSQEMIERLRREGCQP